MADQRQLHHEIDEMIQHCGDIYRKLDANGDDTVTVDEVVNALKNRKTQAKGRQVEILDFLIDHVKTIDRNHDGNISFVEFMRCCDKIKAKYLK